MPRVTPIATARDEHHACRDRVEPAVAPHAARKLDQLHRRAECPRRDRRGAVIHRLVREPAVPAAGVPPVDDVPVRPHHGSEDDAHEPHALPCRRGREQGDKREQRQRDEGSHLGPDRERRRHAGEPRRDCPVVVEQEDHRRDEERRDDEVVLRRRRLESDHRQRRDEQPTEQRLPAVEADPTGDADHADDEPDVGERLDERDVPVGAAERHRREHPELAVRRVRVHVRGAGAVGVSGGAVLQPQACPPEMVDDGVEVVLGRRETERERVAEAGGDGDAEHDAQRVAERVTEPRGCLSKAHTHVAPAARVPGEGRADECETGEERPS